MTLTPTTTDLAQVRKAVTLLAEGASLPGWPLTLVVTELLVNAMAASRPDEVIDLRVTCHSSGFDVRVVDRGPGLSLGALADRVAAPPPSWAFGGRGLYLVGQLADDFSVVRLDGSTVAQVHLAANGASVRAS